MDLDIKELFQWAVENKSKVVGFPGYGMYNPISYFLAEQNQSDYADVGWDVIKFKSDGIVYTVKPSFKLLKLVWYLNNCTSYGNPIYGIDILRRL